MALTLGVEEEFFVVDPASRGLRDDAVALLAAARARGSAGAQGSYGEELRPCMIESRTAICQSLDQVRSEIVGLRGGLIEASRTTGGWIVAAGSLPLADWRTQGFVARPRYAHVAATYAQLAAEHVVCACHVHVGVDGRDTAVEVMNRVRPWLPVLAALASSSPFWMSEDTGYASYRGMVWERWPMAGMPPTYTSYDDYAAGAKLLVDTGTSADAGQVFWDVRPGTRYQTLEFRIADSCPTVDETVIQAGLARALVQTCLSEISRGSAAREARPELLRAAKWRAARFGLVASLLDPVCAEVLPAHALVERMLEYLRPALQLAGDWDELTRLLDRMRRDGSSAERQRRAHAEAGRLEDVVDLLAKETASL